MRRMVLAASFAVASVFPVALAAVPAPQALIAFDGRPTFTEGSDLSYYVWRDGEKWHVRWTTLGQTRVFTGTVRSMGGKLTDLKRIDVEEELKVIRPGRPARVVRGPGGRVRGVAPGRGPVVAAREEDHITKVDDRLIRWNARTDDDIDGFDFKTEDSAALTFDLNVMGTSKPRAVEIGRNSVHPDGNPFTVRIR